VIFLISAIFAMRLNARSVLNRAVWGLVNVLYGEWKSLPHLHLLVENVMFLVVHDIWRGIYICLF
jgi:hypothetical protein